MRVDGKEVGRLRVDRQPEGVRTAREGANLFVPDGNGQPLAPDARAVRQGFLEDSNVGTIDSMVDMISIQRAYTSVQKAVIAIDGIRDTISNNLGRPI